MQKWFTSDLHFGHDKIIEYCNRPFTDVNHMNEIMIQHWNERVEPNDIVYYLGDFIMGDRSRAPEFLARLNGKKHLIYGNHDDLRSMPIISSFDSKTKAGWVSVQEELYVPFDEGVVWMAHIPYGHSNDKRNYKRPEAFQHWDIALGGHVHNRWVVNTEGCINVGGDNYNFYPQTLEELLERAKTETPFDSSIFLPV